MAFRLSIRRDTPVLSCQIVPVDLWPAVTCKSYFSYSVVLNLSTAIDLLFPMLNYSKSIIRYVCPIPPCVLLHSIYFKLKVVQGHVAPRAYDRFPDGYFPGWFFSRKDVSRRVFFPDETFPGKTIPRWSLSRKDVPRMVIFPDGTFPGKLFVNGNV